MWRRLFDVFFWLGASLYFGGMVTIAITAQAIFDSARAAHLSMPNVSPPLEPDRQAAGEIFGVVLQRFAYLEVIALALMLMAISGWLLTQRVVRRSTLLIAALWLVIAVTAAYDAGSLTPRVWAMRDAVRQTASAHAGDPSGAAWPQRMAFDALHVQSENLGKLKAYALLALVLVAAWRGLPIRTGMAQIPLRRTEGTLSPPPSHAKEKG